MSPRKSITPAAPRPPQPPAAPRGLGKRNRLGGAPPIPLHQFGPRFMKLGSLALKTSDWCIPWPNFVGAHTSLSEQMIYRAISKLMGNDPPHPEQGPYVGGVNWTYQDPLLGGRNSRGGQVCDFNIHWNNEDVCVRLQSEYFHLEAGVDKQADEFYEKTHSVGKIIDIYEPDFVADCTGEAACRTVANALAGRDAPNPGYLGTAQQTRKRGGRP